MYTVDITSNIEQVMKDTDDLFWNQIPYVTSRAINNTAFDIRKHIVNVTYPRAFTVRNRVFPSRIFKVKKKAMKYDLTAQVGDDPKVKGGSRDYLAVHASGGRRPSRGRVAIPQRPAQQRTPTGRIRAAQKPRALEGKKGVYVVNQGGRKFIFRRAKGQDRGELQYTIVPGATLRPSFRFHPDARKVFERVILGHWYSEFNKAIRVRR